MLQYQNQQFIRTFASVVSSWASRRVYIVAQQSIQARLRTWAASPTNNRLCRLGFHFTGAFQKKKESNSPGEEANDSPKGKKRNSRGPMVPARQ